jgi:hypothetical protein
MYPLYEFATVIITARRHRRACHEETPDKVGASTYVQYLLENERAKDQGDALEVLLVRHPIFKRPLNHVFFQPRNFPQTSL